LLVLVGNTAGDDQLPDSTRPDDEHHRGGDGVWLFAVDHSGPSFVSVDELLKPAHGCLVGRRARCAPRRIWGESAQRRIGTFDVPATAMPWACERLCRAGDKPFFGVLPWVPEVMWRWAGTLYPEIRELPGDETTACRPMARMEQKCELASRCDLYPRRRVSSFWCANRWRTQQLHGRDQSRGRGVIIGRLREDGSGQSDLFKDAPVSPRRAWHPNGTRG